MAQIKLPVSLLERIEIQAYLQLIMKKVTVYESFFYRIINRLRNVQKNKGIHIVIAYDLLFLDSFILFRTKTPIRKCVTSSYNPTG